ASRFYAALFDWTTDMLTEEGEPYLVFRLDGEDVGGGLAVRSSDENSPRWNSFVSVVSADESAARAQQLGGTVVAGPVDRDGLGRVAGLADPQGATFFVWEAKGHIGAQRLDEPGCLCWTELVTTDLARSQEFYTSLFEWTARHGRSGEYVEFFQGEEPIAGMLRGHPELRVATPYWMPYFAVTDVDDAVEVARRHFARILMRPTDIPTVGRSAVLRDPLGARFGMFGVHEAA
ncbi:MAG TPA: VOC family protein, partial [Vicinamibacterales bacterium]|nr:VOC family protein [Vicinamibacterales bacterium]